MLPAAIEAHAVIVEPMQMDVGSGARLVGGYTGSSQPVPRHIRLGVGGARTIDWAMACLGLAQPIVLVSGFWRSGTTWLQECLAESLGAKTVFEPLSPLNTPRRIQLAARFSGDEDALQAFVPADLSEDDPTWDLLDAAFTGRHGNNFLLSCRRNVAESRRRKIVVKDVRLQFNLPAVHQRFGIPVIHIRRHPCAVVASLLAADWHWSFERIRLSMLMPDAAARLPREFDMDAVSRIAACWALTERHVASVVQDEPWAKAVTYEEMVENPCSSLTAFCKWLGQHEVRAAAFGRPSASIDPAEFTASGRNRHDRWRRSMPIEQITRVKTIADELHPTWRETWA